jgi:hypothetical protein
MPCCGQRSTTPTGRAPNAAAQLLRYDGRTAMTVRGGTTGRRYYFSVPGAVVAVHPLDVASLAAVPHIRRIGRAGEPPSSPDRK